ncbi:hypothetical protein CY34DRAFT_806811 [Suillus luteus UH-Slu-Lm8-n1]|uniref:Unplaced genomic scaffold CY34scaffold_158, whole genome shotgun sequence n=1 Tax=Suillus luteus UH-Slu-Lm8-n1 TaxID=930992 RepID=A0A0C9ZSL5_9AGAM|nr:hypothetical protein CY34DRAFT_806811 [Suillus luteus UH-Slu-Lm8-n1]
MCMNKTRKIHLVGPVYRAIPYSDFQLGFFQQRSTKIEICIMWAESSSCVLRDLERYGIKPTTAPKIPQQFNKLPIDLGWQSAGIANFL